MTRSVLDIYSRHQKKYLLNEWTAKEKDGSVRWELKLDLMESNLLISGGPEINQTSIKPIKSI